MTKPTSYDEITRATVVEPDSSFRPSQEQVRQAHEGFRALDPVEQQALDRVRAALAALGAGAAHVDVELDRDTVTIRGTVADHAMLARVSDAVRGVDGIGAVIDQLVIGS